MSKVLITFLFIVFYTGSTYSQTVVHADTSVHHIMDEHIALNEKMEGKMIGFCVQICFESGNNSREKAEKMRMMFLSKYPQVSAYVSFKEPNFRVRVGDFRTRAEARGFKEKIMADFPSAFVIKDEIRYPKHENKD